MTQQLGGVLRSPLREASSPSCLLPWRREHRLTSVHVTCCSVMSTVARGRADAQHAQQATRPTNGKGNRGRCPHLH